MEKYTTELLLKELYRIYGDKYDYSKTVYNGSREKICLTCPLHGDFYLRIDKIRMNYECPICKNEKNKEKKTHEFIEKAKKIHGNKYDYTKVIYKNSNTKVCIICPEHGEFWQCPINHLQGQGCVKCYIDSRVGVYDMTIEDFIKKANEVHNGRYSYEKSVYKGIKQKILITCPLHGDFEQVAYDHLRGFKCSKCKSDEDRLSNDEFIEKAKIVHGDKYDYSKINYKTTLQPICIICPEHGEFWQRPVHHLLGCGCKECHQSRIEQTIKCFLIEHNIEFIEQHNFKWLGRKTVDFYLPINKTVIECQGEQHITYNKHFHKENGLERQLQNDFDKYNKCIKHGLKMVYICEEKNKEKFLIYNDIYNNDNLFVIKNVYRMDKILANNLLTILELQN